MLVNGANDELRLSLVYLQYEPLEHPIRETRPSYGSILKPVNSFVLFVAEPAILTDWLEAYFHKAVCSD